MNRLRIDPLTKSAHSRYPDQTDRDYEYISNTKAPSPEYLHFFIFRIK